MADVDAYGQAANLYTGQHPTTADEPDRPWAVYLTGPDGYRLLGFDLDARTEPVAAQRDAQALSAALTGAGIAHLVCQSGPSRGRHVWVGLREPAAPALVATLATVVKALCPTLDRAPLSNPATGCLRPPGAPHRHGGQSTVLTGTLDVLTSPTTTVAQLQRLCADLGALVTQRDGEPTGDPDPRVPLPVDDAGHLYLPGPRRELPAASAAALAEDAACGDASAVLWRVLIGAAAARWRHADVAALADTAAGLEHVRTHRDGSARRPRPHTGPDSPAEVLRRQWRKAVRYVAHTPRSAGEDPTFDARAGQLAQHVQQLQDRADASPGRWTPGGGPADRRVLDVLCSLALHALTPVLEADVRRLAVLAGIGRETARTALLRLSADGWIAQVAAAHGPRGAQWTIDPHHAIHSSDPLARSQADPRPAGAGSAWRSTLLAALTARRTASAHDVFTTAPALGHHAGNLYARVTEPATTHDDPALHRLATHGLIERTATGWRRTTAAALARAARDAGVDGRLRERAERYRLERELWAWWQAEATWMRAPRDAKQRRRPAPGQLALIPDAGGTIYGAHPRRSDGRADYRAARAILTGTTTPAPEAAASPAA